MSDTFVPRDGQLVAFDQEVKGAALSRRGFRLGVYHVTDPLGQSQGPVIVPLDPDGRPLTIPATDDTPATLLTLDPTGITVEPFTNASGHWEPRSGQWVLILGQVDGSPIDAEGAHVTSAGIHVGIYSSGGRDASTGKMTDAHVALVRPDGANLRRPNAETSTFDLVTLPPASIVFEPLASKADLPPGRIVSEDWFPRP